MFATFQNSRYNSVVGSSKFEQENCVDIVNSSEFFSNYRDKTRDPIFTEFLQLQIRAIVAVTWEMSPSKAFELSPYFRSCCYPNKLSHAEIIRRVQRSTNVIFQLILAS